jgi:hypothetical protein
MFETARLLEMLANFLLTEFSKKKKRIVFVARFSTLMVV